MAEKVTKNKIQISLDFELSIYKWVYFLSEPHFSDPTSSLEVDGKVATEAYMTLWEIFFHLCNGIEMNNFHDINIVTLSEMIGFIHIGTFGAVDHHSYQPL